MQKYNIISTYSRIKNPPSASPHLSVHTQSFYTTPQQEIIEFLMITLGYTQRSKQSFCLHINFLQSKSIRPTTQILQKKKKTYPNTHSFHIWLEMIIKKKKRKSDGNLCTTCIQYEYSTTTSSHYTRLRLECGRKTTSRIFPQHTSILFDEIYFQHTHTHIHTYELYFSFDVCYWFFFYIFL